MSWGSLLVGVPGVVFLGFGALFGDLTLKLWQRQGWSDRWGRAYLLTRTATSGIVGAAMLAAAIFRWRDGGYVAGGAILAGAVVYEVIGRHVRRTDRASPPT
jgi:hypothetical protein